MYIIDLFSGCGGMSLGFKWAGMQPILAIEKDAWAAETYAYNLPATELVVKDITQIKDITELGFDNEGIEGILSGSPCQSYSICGKRDKNDPRGALFMEFIRFIKHYKPKFCLMENVNGILSMHTISGAKVKDIIIEEIENAGYDVHIYRLNARDFGVPQERNRVFFIGFRKDLGIKNFEIHTTIGNKPVITIEDAIMDLPQIQAKEGMDEMAYPKEPMNEYQSFMRSNSTKVYNHVAMKHSERIIERFKHIKIGQSVIDVDNKYGAIKKGTKSTFSGKAYRQNNQRPFPDKPSPTITANFQSNFIHPYLDRNFTAREAARLQSFPDDFIFKGKRMTMSWEKNLNQFHQIGNAVPPLLAKSIAEQIKTVLE